MKNNKNTTTLYCLCVMLTIWCTWNSVNNGNIVTELSNLNTNLQLFGREVSNLIDRTNVLENYEPEVIIKEVVKEVEVIKEIEVPVKIEEILPGVQ
tara:strand:- start:26 stop:313 length:288 start_codon:yes stop_codon:yes gene_type:complete